MTRARPGSDLRVLWVDDDHELTSGVSEYLSGIGYQVECAHDLSGAADRIAASSFDVAIVDLNLPDGSGFSLLQDTPRERVREFVVLTGHGSVNSAIQALRHQVFDFLIKPIELTELSNVLARAGGRRHRRGAGEELQPAPAGGDAALLEQMLIGSSPAMREVQALVQRASTSDINVFLHGESGTGKEVAAQCLHRLSQRSRQPFVAFNCGAMSPFLAASELFGHEKGSFTGAQNARRGIFERAEGGTLFLDEITEMPLDLQTSLLRVLETGTILRVGGDRELPVDVRLIAATNRDPLRSVEQGRLRLDLYYRLQVFPIVLPALRERRGDIPLLAQHFLSQFDAGTGVQHSFSSGAIARLVQHDWPGNVRELRNLVERSRLMSAGIIEPEHLLLQTAPPSADRNSTAAAAPVVVATADVPILRGAEHQLILQALQDCGGNKTRAAARLGISVRTLYNKLKRYGVADPPRP